MQSKVSNKKILKVLVAALKNFTGPSSVLEPPFVINCKFIIGLITLLAPKAFIIGKMCILLLKHKIISKGL